MNHYRNILSLNTQLMLNLSVDHHHQRTNWNYLTEKKERLILKREEEEEEMPAKLA